MKPSLLHRIRQAAAFSLVEITLAIGLVSFVLVALLGLFGVAIKSGRTATDGTLLPQMIQYVRGKVESGTLPTAGSTTLYYFDDTGTPLNTATGATYTITLSARHPSASSEVAHVGTRLLMVNMAITYPGGTRTVVSSLTL